MDIEITRWLSWAWDLIVIDSLKSPEMEILITADSGDAAEKIARHLPGCDNLNCAGLADNQLTLRSLKGLNIVWSQEDLARLVCHQSCRLLSGLSERHL